MNSGKVSGKFSMYSVLFILFLATVFQAVLFISSATAHGIAGKRFFPTTFQVDDPFVSDELSLLFSHIKKPAEGDTPAMRSSDISLEYAKRITPHFGIIIGETYSFQKPQDGGSTSGFQNLELMAKYQFFTSAAHETIVSFGTAVELGGTGTRRVGAESFSAISPALFFGKGFGDLPESVKFLKPFAITGVIGPNFPTRSKNVTITEEEEDIERNPVTLTWGLTLQYSLQYLQSYVKDIGLGAPFNRMVLVVEFPMETALNRGKGGETTGSVNPGIIWFGKKVQFGVAAQVPINSRSGKNIGVLGLFHIFIEDLFPKSIGKPIFP